MPGAQRVSAAKANVATTRTAGAKRRRRPARAWAATPAPRRSVPRLGGIADVALGSAAAGDERSPPERRVAFVVGAPVAQHRERCGAHGLRSIEAVREMRVVQL